MIAITESTRISAILKAHPDALDVIISMSPHFEKLRNPILRKLLAPRVSIAEAARMGKCDVASFFEKLKPLGFIVEEKAKGTGDGAAFGNAVPSKVNISMDVRRDIETGNDPLLKISEAVSRLRSGETLELVNSFVPYPLIRLMSKRGCVVNVIEEAGLVRTYFTAGNHVLPVERETGISEDAQLFDDLLQRFQGRFREINVRELPMPQPMMKILAELEELPEGDALFVKHKKIPVMLLPELKERGFKFAFGGEESGILMIIYKA